MNYFGKGIAVTSGFDLNAKAPLDSRTVVSSKTVLDSMDDIKKYNGLVVYVEDENKNYRLENNTWKVVIDQAVNDLTTGGTEKSLTAEQGKVLKGQIDSVNSSLSTTTSSLNTHKADTNVHVTTADKTRWNDKYTKTEADQKFATQASSNSVADNRATGSRVSVTTPATAGWYRIAKTAASIANCLGHFTITGAVSGRHDVTSLEAGISYGVTPTITQLTRTEYTLPVLTKARIVYHPTYTNNYAYLEVYLTSATTTSISVEMFASTGWTLINPALQTTIPDGYSQKEITFVKDAIVSNLEGNAATATKLQTTRTINGVEFDGTQNITITANPNAHTHTKAQITDFPTSMPANGGNSDTVDGKHVNDAVQDALWTGTKITTELGKKAAATGSTTQDFSTRQLNVSGNIIPATNGTLDIGSPTNRFGNIYVNEAHLASNTLYIDGVPVIGSTADTIDIKADPGQGIMVRTTGVGATKVLSENQVMVSTSGMNADVNITATGTGSKVNVSGQQQVNFTAPDIYLDGETTIKKNLVINGDLTVLGENTTINTTTLAVEDNIIEINKGQTGSGVSKGTAGFSVNRGDAAAQMLVFDEADDKFKVGPSTALLAIATESFVNSGLSGKANSTHTHNYAGSSSAGGAATSALACTGNSATATKLATARTINGVSFDGSANITITADPNAHNQTSSTITAMTGYAKPSATSAITATDTLNSAIGKLEKALDGKPGEVHNHNSSQVTAMTGYVKASSTASISTGDTLNVAVGKLERALDDKAASSHTHAASQISGLPTSLPANGGNADTVDGKHATDFAAASHNHDYLPLSGGTLTGKLTLPGLGIQIGEGLEFLSDENYFGTNLDARIIRMIDANDANGNVDGGLVIQGFSGSVAKEVLTLRTNGEFNYLGNKVYHAGNKPTPSEIGAANASHGTHVSYHGSVPLVASGSGSVGSAATVSRGDHVHPAQTTVSGNAGSATVLQTARTINGTSFNGSANITTAAWGTARTISLTGGVTGSVVTDGSSNITIATTVTNNSHTHSDYSLTSHTHNEVKVTDIRGTDPTPDSLTGNKISTFFNDHANYGGAWQSGFTVAGWTSGYAVWQMRSYSSSGTHDNKWYLRSGKGSTWGSWYKIYHEGDKPTPAEIGAAPASHGTHVSYGTATTTLTPDMTGAVGSSANLARQDHTHTITCGTAVGLSNSSSNSEGSSSSFARADHTHAITGFALSSHTHDYAASTHNHNASQVTAMTGYAKASAVAAIATTDTLNVAIGKLEKALDSKQAAGSYAAATHTHTGYADANHTHTGYAASSHTHSVLTRGSYLTGSNYNGGTATTWAVDATSANTGSKVVARDGSGNFSAGTVTTTAVKVGNGQATIQYNATTQSIDFIFA